jgi:hypothetical protein
MWKRLKRAETKAMRERFQGQLTPKSVATLRALLQAVKDEPDAEMAICYHGASALVCEAEGRLEDAARHREIEISKIAWLRASMKGEPPDLAAFALQHYGEAELLRRREWLASIRQALGRPGR